MNDFFKKTYEYLVSRIENSFKDIDQNIVAYCLELLSSGGKNHKRVIVDGAGRSLQSVLLLTKELESEYGIRVNQVSNANLRPLRKGDIFVVNSRSGTGKSYSNAIFAKKKGLDVIFITGNEALKDEFENVILLKSELNREKTYAPLGTEFEQASAVVCSCMGYAYNELEKLKSFNLYCDVAIEGMKSNLDKLTSQEKVLDNFIKLMNDYLEFDNKSVVYFKGVGINEII